MSLQVLFTYNYCFLYFCQTKNEVTLSLCLPLGLTPLMAVLLFLLSTAPYCHPLPAPPLLTTIKHRNIFVFRTWEPFKWYFSCCSNLLIADPHLVHTVTSALEKHWNFEQFSLGNNSWHQQVQGGL